MAQQTINIGTAPNSGNGDPLRTAFTKTNANFTELYAQSTSAANPTAVAGASAINGVATTFMRSDAAPAVAKGTASTYGIVKPDGTSILSSAGDISVPIGTSAAKGILQVDGTTITATAGVISAVGGGVSSFNTRTGAVTLTSGDVTTALTYTPANLVSPTFTGTPAAPTATGGTNTTQIATTAFVQAAVAGGTAGVASFNTRTGIVTLTSGDVTTALTYTPLAPGGALGTPSSGTLTNATGLPISTGVSGLATGVATFLATPSSANLAAALTDETGTGAAVFATSPTLVTPVLGTPTSGTLSNCTVDGTSAVGFRQIPQNSQSTAYTAVLADDGKHILHPIGDNNARTFTIPANSSVAYPIGTALTFVNMINTVTIAITTDTMYLGGAGTTGSRTLAAYGTATALKITSTSWIISGTGLT